MCSASLVSINIAYLSIAIRLTQHILQALLVHHCIHPPYVEAATYLRKRKTVAILVVYLYVFSKCCNGSIGYMYRAKVGGRGGGGGEISGWWDNS